MRLGLVLALVSTLAACGGDTASESAGSFTPVEPGVLTVATSIVPSPGFWEGTAARPTGGMEYGLARALAERFGLDTVRVEVVPFGRLVAGDLAGADLALALLTPTDERDEVLDFSAPYLDAAPTVVARAGVDVPDLETARGLRWGAVRSTTFVGLIDDTIRPDEPPLIVPDQDALLEALAGGRLDAALFDLPLAVAIADRSDGRLDVAAKLPEPETIAAALPDGSPNDEAVDTAMRAFVADDTIDELLDRWVGPDADEAENDVPLLYTSSS